MESYFMHHSNGMIPFHSFRFWVAANTSVFVLFDFTVIDKVYFLIKPFFFDFLPWMRPSEVPFVAASIRALVSPSFPESDFSLFDSSLSSA